MSYGKNNLPTSTDKGFESGKETMKWNSKKVDEVLLAMDRGYEVQTNPFWDGKPDWRQAGILFEYTPEEVEELKKCSEDVLYFANKYCFAMTDEGIRSIQLRDYQEDILKAYQDHRFCVFLAPRQCGKCFLFHNLLIIKNKDGVTSMISLGELYYNKLKFVRGLTLIEHLKLYLWKTYSRLSRSQDTYWKKIQEDAKLQELQ